MFSSSEAFTAHATIGAGYCMLIQQNERLSKHLKQPPIIRAVDKATGYDDQIHKEISESIIDILTDVIKAKKVIGADYSNDEEMINKAKEFLTKLTPTIG